MNPEQQRARHTVAEELRANLRRHQSEVSDGLTAQATALEREITEARTQFAADIAAAKNALERRIEAAVQAIEARASVLHRGFWGRLNWLLTGR